MVELVELFMAAGLFVGAAEQPVAAAIAANNSTFKINFILAFIRILFLILILGTDS
ncbi:MAG TPA: hypothetical protein VFF11_07965 [Candidatus Binatia bacterium]|nr:hypothetical protein [Candidatus Binatia bacterium]